jgi:hypothetical protein
MHDPLQELIQELRKKSCPPSVLERVAQRIGRAPGAPVRWWQGRTWVIAGACLLVLVGIAAWQVSLRRDARAAAVAEAQARRDLVIRQTQGALVYIGHALIEAATHTEEAVLDEALPPLRNIFQTTKSKLTKLI